MQIDNQNNFLFENSRVILSGGDMVTLLANNSSSCISIKNEQSIYQYANQNFANMMGLVNSEKIRNLTNVDLIREKSKLRIYRLHDEEVLDTCKPISVCEEVKPVRKGKITWMVRGAVYPLLGERSVPYGVLGIFEVMNSISYLSLDLLVCLSEKELDALLVRRSWKINLWNMSISISKREIQCIAGLIQGKHAGEIARALSLQQSTVEFYLVNLKSKLGASSRSELLDVVFNQKIIQQIEL